MHALENFIKSIQNSGAPAPEEEQDVIEEVPLVEKISEQSTDYNFNIIESFQSQIISGKPPNSSFQSKNCNIENRKPEIIVSTVESLRNILRQQFMSVARPLSLEHNLGDYSANVTLRYDV